MSKNKMFIPSLKFHWLTPFYDPLVDLSGRVKNIRKAQLVQANIGNDNMVLDFGCGIATLTIMAKNKFPQARMHGIDIDPSVLEIARNKAKNNEYNIFLKTYGGISLPYDNIMFERVLSSFVFHHLNRSQKIRALKEIYRVLKINGELHIADFGKAKNIFIRLVFLPIQFFDGFINTNDNIKGFFPEIIKQAGFDKVFECQRINTLVGNVSLYKAIKLK